VNRKYLNKLKRECNNLKNPSNIGDIVNMLIHVEIGSPRLQYWKAKWEGQLLKCAEFATFFLLYEIPYFVRDKIIEKGRRFFESNDHTTRPSLEFWAGSFNLGIFFKQLLSSSGMANLKPHKWIKNYVYIYKKDHK
jgi:hypothetical protein